MNKSLLSLSNAQFESTVSLADFGAALDQLVSDGNIEFRVGHRMLSLDLMPMHMALKYARVFGHCNSIVLRTLLEPVFSGDWNASLLEYLNLVAEHLHSFQKRKSAGKRRESTNDSSLAETLEDLLHFVTCFSDYTLVLGSEFAQRQANGLVFGIVNEIYGLTSAQLVPLSGNAVFVNESALLDILENADIGRLGLETEQARIMTLARNLKTKTVEWVSRILGSAVYIPFESSQATDPLDLLCDFMIMFINATTLDGPATLLTDAPFLVDFEVLSNLSGTLTKLTLGQSFDKTRIEYLIMTLNHFLVFSGNAQAKNWVPSQTSSDSTVISTPVNGLASLSIQESIQDDVELMTRISTVQELFPHLDHRFIEACLKEYQQDPEQVIMKILEADLPSHLKALMTAEPRSQMDPTPKSDQKDVYPISKKDQEDVLAERRNVFNGDEYDVFAGNKPKLVIDRKKESNVLQHERDDSFVNRNKELILAQSYDDDYDDEYDEQGFKVSRVIEDEPELSETDKAAKAIEETLVGFYHSNPALFDISARKSPSRLAAMKELNMTQEQFEGWYKVLERMPNKGSLLQQYEFRGNQPLETVEPPKESQKEEERKPGPKDFVLPPRTYSNHRGRGSRKAGHTRKMERGM